MKKDKKKERRLNVDIEESIGALGGRIKRLEFGKKTASGESAKPRKRKASAAKTKKELTEVKKRLFLNNILAVFMILSVIILIVMVVYFYNIIFLHFQIGDYVYKTENEIKIGQIREFKFPTFYMVEWHDGELTKELPMNIKEIKSLKESEVARTLKGSNIFYLYSGLEEAEISFIASSIGDQEPNELNCTPRFICSNWTGCEMQYELNNLIKKDYSLAKRVRYCSDSNKCMPDFVYSKECSLGEKITIKKTDLENGEYLEVYDQQGQIVGKLELIEIGNVKQLSIRFIL